MSLTPEQQRLMADKHELVQTTHSRGWQVALNIMRELIEDATNKLINCTDDAQLNGLQKKAQAAREFHNTFLRRVEEMKQLEIDESYADFVPVSID